MDEWTQTLGALPLLLIAAGAVALILLLIIKVRLHAFIVLVLVSLLTALATGIPVGSIGKVLIDSFSSTVGTVALLVGFGAMLGALIESSGGARVLAEKMVSVFGEKRAAIALSVASLLMGFPMFFDAGLVVMLPIIFAVARRIGGKHMLLYGISAAAAFSVMHVFVPPHPGPITASETYGANLGLVLLIGLVVAIPTWYLSGYLWARFIDRRIPLAIPRLFGEDVEPTNPPKAGTVIGVIAIPLVLILLNTGSAALVSAGAVDGTAVWVQALASSERARSPCSSRCSSPCSSSAPAAVSAAALWTRSSSPRWGRSARSSSSPAPVACSAASFAPRASATRSRTLSPRSVCRSSSPPTSSPSSSAWRRVRPRSPS